MLLCNFDARSILTAVRLVYDWGYLLFLIPLVLLCAWALVQRRRP